MKNRHSYSYSILRYVHDVATSEFVNIGVVVHSKEAGYFEVRCKPSYRRISEFFPNLNTKSFRALVKTINARFKDISGVCANSLDMAPANADLDALLSSVLPKDDSALFWSPIATGLSFDLSKTLAQLFERYVTKYNHAQLGHKRTDEDVLKSFSRVLESRQIASYFSEKVIEGVDDKVEFKSAWKNGVWHCIEPISFDFAESERIKGKAHLFLGRMTSVADTSEKFKLYIVLGVPSDVELRPAFEKAVQILKKVHVEKEIYTESQAEELASHFQNQIKLHERAVH